MKNDAKVRIIEEPERMNGGIILKKAGKTLSALLAAALMVTGCGAAEKPKQAPATSGGSVRTESEKKEGQAMNLKDAFGKDFKVGVAVNPYQLKDQEISKLIRENFNSITMENAMKPENVLDQAALYINIYFAGMPAMLVYNFGAAILRAIGDTRRPLFYLLTAGVINVIMNMIFVIGFHMGVAGVALATVISQVISACLIVRCLMQSEGMYHLELRNIRIYKGKLLQIVRIGLPAGLQGAVFSISNVLIQSSINSFGSVAMAGSTAAGNIEGFVYTAMNSVYQTALSFVSQNIGGGKKERIPKIALECFALVFVIGAVLGNAAYRFGNGLLGIYSSDAEVIQYGLSRMRMICQLYFLCGMMDVSVGILRGLGYAIMPMLVSLAGACGLRVIWIFTIFRWHHSLDILFMSYPITWTVTLVAHLICLAFVWEHRMRSIPR